MKESRVAKFQADRETLNETVMKYAGRNLKRFYSLDSQVYHDGALNVQTKELLGFVASLVLRCDDCITYHTIRCHEEGVSSDAFEEAVTIGLAVGGSITIPHIRRCMQVWEELTENGQDGESS